MSTEIRLVSFVFHFDDSISCVHFMILTAELGLEIFQIIQNLFLRSNISENRGGKPEE